MFACDLFDVAVWKPKVAKTSPKMNICLPIITQHELQHELKMGLGTPPGPKVAKVGPRTPSGQKVFPHLEPKWLPEGGHFEAKIEPKIMLISRGEKVGHLEGPRVAKGTLGPPK